MKNKLFIPYVLLEFILFVLSYIASVGVITINQTTISLIALLLNTLFVFLVATRNKKDKLFGFLFSFLLVLGILSYIFTGSSYLEYILFIAAFELCLIRTTLEKDIYVKIALIFAPVVLMILIVLKAMNLIIWSEFLYSLIVVIALSNVVFMVREYNKAEIKEKPNWFFGFAGLIFFIVWASCSEFKYLLEVGSQMYGLFDLIEALMFIPSIFMINLSFIFFEPREA